MGFLFHLLIGFVLAGSISLSARAADPPANYQGLWWNSPPDSESGWGINLAHQGDTVFATWFTYGPAGEGWWLSMTAYKTAEGVYAGTLYESQGPAFHAVPFDPAKVSRTPVGAGTLSFRGPDDGAFRYTVKGTQQTKYITRLAYDALPTCNAATLAELAAATTFQDLWWVPGGAESGWGINLAHQGNVIFATWFTYDGAGKPLWLSVTATRLSQHLYSGPLIRTTGPPFDAMPFDPAKVVRTEVGTATFSFVDGNTATLSYSLDGVNQSKAITRLLFAPATGTRCGEPTRVPAPVSVVAVGDIAQCFDQPASSSGAARTAALVRPEDGLVLTLGDNAYEAGTPEEFSECFHPTWGAFKDRIRPAPGNHDLYTPGGAGYYAYFGAQAGPDRRGYYSFDYGGWHIISLNGVADLRPQSPQHQWLVADLAASRDSLCTIAVLHYPAFNSGVNYGDIVEMRPVFEMLYDAGVELLLSGHEHVYERFAPQRPDRTPDPARGLRQFVVGTGGANLTGFRSPSPNSEFRFNASWGVLRLSLGPGRYAWQFVPVGGGPALDSGTGTCHP